MKIRYRILFSYTAILSLLTWIAFKTINVDQQNFDTDSTILIIIYSVGLILAHLMKWIAVIWLSGTVLCGIGWYVGRVKKKPEAQIGFKICTILNIGLLALALIGFALE